jgi:glycosyltransferase involved in cell wall biosynthesis
MIRVLHLRSSCGLYGADRALLDLCEGLGARMHPIVGSIVTAGREDVLGTEAVRRGLRTTRIDSRGRADLASVAALAERIRSLQIELLHAHDYKSLSLALLAAHRVHVPVVATFHGDTAATPALRVYEALARVLGNATRGVAAVSAPLCRTLRGWIRTAPVWHIPNGIRAPSPCSADERDAARRLFDLPPDAEVLAIVGRLSVEKGHLVLLDALRRLPERPVLLVAGEGGMEAALRARAAGLEVRWLGFRADTRPVYAAADAVVLPSLTEGLPLVALEAMALGRPLVASAVGELPTLLSRDAGVLVPPGDRDQLAASLQQVLADAPKRARMAGLARERVQRHYRLESTAERYAKALYAPALERSVRDAGSAAGWVQTAPARRPARWG